MVAATQLAVEAKQCPPEVLSRLVALLERIGSPTRAADLPATAELMATMRVDKKAAGARLRLVLPVRLGGVETRGDVADKAVAEAWEALRR